MQRQHLLAREIAEALAKPRELGREREVDHSEFTTCPPSTTTMLPVM
jgi:hypothetical protein